MNKIEEMINKLCPEGVTMVKFVDYADVLYGYPAESTLFSEDESYIPLIRIRDVLPGTSNTFYEGIYPKEYIIKKGDILVGMDGNFNLGCWKDRDALLNQRVCKLSTKDSNKLLNGFIFHYMKPLFKQIELNTAGGSVKHLSAKIINKIDIPLPPIEVQKEIVNILDTFSAYRESLDSELAARKEQFEIVRYKLFHSYSNPTVFKLSDCCNLEKGKTPIMKAVPGNYPLVVTTSERRSNTTYQFDRPSVCVPLVSSRGHGIACLNRVYYQDGKFALGNILCGVTPKDTSLLNARYLYHYLNFTKDRLIVPLMSGGANVSLTVDKLKTVKVEIPSMNDQIRIVDILDTFEEFIESETSGLPAEIAAVQEQYEYYQNKLLTFKTA